MENPETSNADFQKLGTPYSIDVKKIGAFNAGTWV